MIESEVTSNEGVDNKSATCNCSNERVNDLERSLAEWFTRKMIRKHDLKGKIKKFYIYMN